MLFFFFKGFKDIKGFKDFNAFNAFKGNFLLISPILIYNIRYANQARSHAIAVL